MTQFVRNAQDSETFSLYAGIRHAELNARDWNRDKSVRLAQNEGISLNDEHWAVIAYLRDSYIEYGLPRFVRTTARVINRQFSAQDGSKYMYGLFADGPFTQGSRLASVRIPANATDVSFGTSY